MSILSSVGSIRKNEIVLCATSFDLSGKDLFAYPAKLEDVKDYVRLEKGEPTHGLSAMGPQSFHLARSWAVLSWAFSC